MSQYPQQHEWLSLIEISGPFLAANVLNEAFPQGLEGLDAQKRKHLRQAYEEWREAVDTDDPQLSELHAAWIDEVLSRTLELDENNKGDVLKRSEWCSQHLSFTVPEQAITTTPNFAVVNEHQANKPLLLVQVYSQSVNLDLVLKQDGWVITPADKMVQLCRAQGCRLGLVTNGERWMLVDAPIGATTSFASWYARIWNQEPITLQAFVHLLGIRRFFVADEEQLPALFDRSLKFQDEVTDALGEQVRRAVEVLIQALDKADQDHNRELLRNTSEPELYEAALTVMMRLVFLLSAEERGLLLMGDERYEANYALSTLRMQLRIEAPEILEQRLDAWSRLLAIFRAVYGGIDHVNLRLPALGGSLFDPDRFPFLEGRAKGTAWRSDPAKPLPIDNRTVLLLLDAIQMFQGRTLSYRALDVEQIGYVYEGLLERTVKRIDDITFDLGCTKNAKNPLVKLAELDSVKLDGAEKLAEFLAERSGSSANRIRNDLNKSVDNALAERLLTACQGNTDLRNRAKPYAHLLRVDPWGYPLVYPKGAFIVTSGSDRRETGTHYTPKSLTESIVTETLTPIVYVGPSQGFSRDQWILKSPSELLELKICDPAMGSGAFLVQVCRWLSDRLVETWAIAESVGNFVTVNGIVLKNQEGNEPLPKDTESRIVIARRLIAERCLYGVDLNPLAVELAKLSIWLITLAKGRPFGFLDHSLRCGDSLLGIHRLDQLTQLATNPSAQGQRRLFGQNIEQAVLNATELRQQLSEIPIRDIRDVEAMAHLDADARRNLEVPECIADAFIGDIFAAGPNSSTLENGLASLAALAGQAVDGNLDSLDAIRRRSLLTLSTDLPADKPARQPFHWPLEFPEVFVRERGGFDGMVGNPPFLGGQRITGVAGTAFRDWLVAYIAEGRRGSADLVAYFFLRSWALLRNGGGFGLLAVNTIAEGDTRQVGLEAIVAAGAIIRTAYPKEPWPGAAAVVTSRIHVHKGSWFGVRALSGCNVSHISAYLSAQDTWSLKRLNTNRGIVFQGSNVLGMGFILDADEARQMLDADPKNSEVIFPYLNGEDINTSPVQKTNRWVISFWDWPEEVAKKYVLPFEKVRDLVKPVRDQLGGNPSAEGRKKKWWLFGRDARALYHAIGRGNHFHRHPDGWVKSEPPLKQVMACSLVQNYLKFSIVPNDQIFAHRLGVFASADESLFAILSSTFHQVWARETSSTMRNDLNYSTTDSFETFPLPFNNRNVISLLGKKYNAQRTNILREESIGLTKLYNRFNNPIEQGRLFCELRQLHSEIDKAVSRAYGWEDLDLEHGFHEVPYLPENDRVRFTISETARIEVLRRLSELNKQRYEEEVKAGLHGKPLSKKPSAAFRRAALLTIAESDAQAGFDFGKEEV